MELLRLAKDIIDRKTTPIEFPCFMLGGTVARNKEEMNELLSALLLLTYRSNFIALPRSNVTSDKGWGCLIRTSQMLLARALRLHGKCSLEWFMDTDKESAKLSIHRIVKLARDQRQNFEAGFWSPSQGCEAIKRAVQDLRVHELVGKGMQTYIATSGCVLLEEVRSRIDNCNSSLLLLVPIRAVAHRCITQNIFLAMSQLLQLKQCCGIVGGVPNRSYYIIGVSGERFLYLDPHTTQPAFTSETTLGQYCEQVSTLPAVSWKRIDSSILLGFYIRDKDDWLDFLFGLKEVRRLSSEELVSVQNTQKRSNEGWDEIASSEWVQARQDAFMASRRSEVAAADIAAAADAVKMNGSLPPAVVSRSRDASSSPTINNASDKSSAVTSPTAAAGTPPFVFPPSNNNSLTISNGSIESNVDVQPLADMPKSTSGGQNTVPFTPTDVPTAEREHTTEEVEVVLESDESDDENGLYADGRHVGLGDELLLDNAIRALLNRREMQEEAANQTAPTSFVGVTLLSDRKVAKKKSLRKKTRALWQRLTTGNQTDTTAAANAAPEVGSPKQGRQRRKRTDEGRVSNSTRDSIASSWDEVVVDA